MSAGTAPDLCAVAWRGRTVQIEHEWIAPERTTAPLMVFLHEGLGSVAMWRDFPAQLCDALGWRGLMYSRPGYGRSTPRAPDEHWTPDFMHQQALEILPALLEALGIDTRQQPPWLFGHSDGGSIALIHAANFPQRVAGCVVVAPHILVEDISVAASKPPASPLSRAICAHAWRATTTNRIRPSGAGTVPGFRQNFAAGRWRPSCRSSPARCWRCRD